MCSIESATKSRTPLSFQTPPNHFLSFFFFSFYFSLHWQQYFIAENVLSKRVVLLGEPGIYIYNIHGRCRGEREGGPETVVLPEWFFVVSLSSPPFITQVPHTITHILHLYARLPNTGMSCQRNSIRRPSGPSVSH